MDINTLLESLTQVLTSSAVKLEDRIGASVYGVSADGVYIFYQICSGPSGPTGNPGCSGSSEPSTPLPRPSGDWLHKSHCKQCQTCNHSLGASRVLTFYATGVSEDPTESFDAIYNLFVDLFNQGYKLAGNKNVYNYLNRRILDEYLEAHGNLVKEHQEARAQYQVEIQRVADLLKTAIQGLEIPNFDTEAYAETDLFEYASERMNIPYPTLNVPPEWYANDTYYNGRLTIYYESGGELDTAFQAWVDSRSSGPASSSV